MLDDGLSGNLERAMGIEPTRSAWKADVLPLNYARRVEAALEAFPSELPQVLIARSVVRSIIRSIVRSVVARRVAVPTGLVRSRWCRTRS